MTDELGTLWTRYKQEGDREAREQLILHYVQLVKYVVGRLGLRASGVADEDDLVNYGIIGLIQAIERYDPDRDVKFETYARLRIKGQVLDSLQRFDLLPRSARRRTRRIRAAITELRQRLGRMPTDDEVAEHLDLTSEQYYAALADSTVAILSLDRRRWTDGEGKSRSLYESLEDTSLPAPTEHLEARDMHASLAAAIRQLPERQQLLLSLYYNDGLTMKEVGEVLGVSESRISQIHAKAILTLQSLLEQKAEGDVATDEKR